MWEVQWVRREPASPLALELLTNKSRERDREVYLSKTLVIPSVKTKMKVAEVIGNFIY